ncbi:hypothetical protein VNO78_14226 [Psophocarpus tetragonolobus]|uniref:MBD domain-containing protein n=1 Tax=Psophocarpus tetragonolobus TaxID=3891 RepID=A0AAN9XQX8_PSOTE
MAAPFEVGREDEHQHSSIVTSSHFRLPDGWLVEEKPRASKSHVDKYYYEPGTGRKFRSLLAVQRHLAGESVDYVIAKKMVPKNEHTKFIESGAGQQFSSMKAIDNLVSGENAFTATSKSAMKSGMGEQRACGVRSYRKPVHKRSSVTEEGKITPNSLKHSIQSVLSEKPDSQKKTKLEKCNRASMHNLTAPPPPKVSWVLSGPGGVWSPFLDDSIVQESEKLKWSEAFVLSIHDNEVINDFNS